MKGKLRFLMLVALCFICSDFSNAQTWKTRETTHFKIYCQSGIFPSGLNMGLERIYGRLKIDFASFAPWIREVGSKEKKDSKINVYVYPDPASYVNGKFKPPKWSRGIINIADKRIVTYDNVEEKPNRLLNIITHELAHLVFGSFFEGGTEPPEWLDEGFAVFAEDYGLREDSQWNKALLNVPETDFQSFDEYLSSSVSQNEADTGVSQDEEDNKAFNWYLQAYGIVRFLFRPQKKLPFKRFCENVKNGTPVNKALFLSYGFFTIQKFEDAWRTWLREDAGKEEQSPYSVNIRFVPMEMSDRN
jgi:Peptidase MA superfamily